jgi:nicotinate phosphoribosyltransferase
MMDGAPDDVNRHDPDGYPTGSRAVYHSTPRHSTPRHGTTRNGAARLTVIGPRRLDGVNPALMTDHYEFTMLAAALKDGTAGRQCVFEAFARRLPTGRRYGVVAGTARIVDALATLRFGEAEIDFLRSTGVVDDDTAGWLADYRFGGDIDGYAEGELFFPGSPILTVSGSFAECVILETFILSVLNHDSAIAAAAARMVTAARGRPLIEMGSRRTHEESAVAAARAAYLAGFAFTSNLEAGRRYGVPTSGTAAHAFTLLHDNEPTAFASQIAALGKQTTLLVDTYDISRGIRNAIEVAGPGLRAIRIDSGDLAVLAAQSRELLDSLGAVDTKIIVSGDLDEYSIAALAAEPVDVYGAGTAVVTGSGAATAGLIYKLVEVDGRGVVKRSENKATIGGRKTAIRRHKPSGTATEEIVVSQGNPLKQAHDRELQRPFVRGGQPVSDRASLSDSREHLRSCLISIPWEGLKLSAGDPAIPIVIRGAA